MNKSKSPHDSPDGSPIVKFGMSTSEYRNISIFKTIGHRLQSNQRQISTASIFVNPGFTSTVEVDSHADSFVAGKNCIPMHYTERSCDVQPYSDDYAPVKNVPIITAATGYTSANGLNYILVFQRRCTYQIWATAFSTQINYAISGRRYKTTHITQSQ